MSDAPNDSTTAVLVRLCDEDGRTTATAARDAIHTASTPLHRAFSCYLHDDEGRILLTRRALTKKAWPGVWTNACCGHPGPRESDEEAVRRRVGEELGATIRDLRLVLPDFRYRAVDPSGIVEHEVCPVFVAQIDPDELRPDPAEVMETSWVFWPDLHATASTMPRLLSPWSARQVREIGPGGPRAHRAPPATFLDDVEHLVEQVLDDIDARWRRALPTGLGRWPHDPPRWAREAVLGGGKRLRPRFVELGLRAAGGGGRADAVRAAAALELLHAFGLVHDDVMDRSDRRRGRPSVHRRAQDAHAEHDLLGDARTFGDSLAVLLGDLLHHAAERTAAALPAAVHDEWCELVVELVAGQSADVVGAGAPDLDLDLALRTAAIKSGAYTIRRPLRLGAIAAGADAELLAVLDRYALHLGRAFSLRDDWLGVWGEPTVTGKPAGDDLREAKPTVIRAMAAAALDPGDARLLDRRAVPEPTAEDLARLRDAMTRAGVDRDVERLVEQEAGQACAALEGAALPDDVHAELVRTVDVVCWRQS